MASTPGGGAPSLLTRRHAVALAAAAKGAYVYGTPEGIRRPAGFKFVQRPRVGDVRGTVVAESGHGPFVDRLDGCGDRRGDVLDVLTGDR